MSIFAPPSINSTSIQPKSNRLKTPEQQQKYETVLQHFANPGYQLGWIPTKPGTAPLSAKQREGVSKDQVQVAGLSPDEKMFLSKECIIRFLIADKWTVDKTIPRLEECLIWRREMGLDNIEGMAVELQDLGKMGKLFTIGYTIQGQPFIYWKGAKHSGDPPVDFKSVRMMFYMVERAMDLMVAGVEDVGFIADLGGKVDRSWAAVDVNKHILHDIQRYYPERLGFAAVQNLGMVGKLLVNVMWPFVDPATKSKVQFDQKLADGKVAQPAMVPKHFGGSLEPEWNADLHWPETYKECLARRKYRAQKWSELGGTVGLSELDFLLPINI